MSQVKSNYSVSSSAITDCECGGIPKEESPSPGGGAAHRSGVGLGGVFGTEKKDILRNDTVEFHDALSAAFAAIRY